VVLVNLTLVLRTVNVNFNFNSGEVRIIFIKDVVLFKLGNDKFFFLLHTEKFLLRI